MANKTTTPNIRENDSKFKELILLLCRRSEGDESFGATKLNKLLFFSDFVAYRRFGSPITGQRYQRLDNGPAPRLLKPFIARMEEANDVRQVERDHHGYAQKRTLALREPNWDVFESNEIALVTELIQEFWGKSARQMSDLSHEFRGWQLARDGEDIPYEVALVDFEMSNEADSEISGELRRELVQLNEELS